jgi:hypothetical protein
VRFGSSDIRDGSDMTILLTENIHKDQTQNNQPGTWAGPLQPKQVFVENNSNYGPNYQADMSFNPEQRFGLIWPPLNSNNPLDGFAKNFFEPINRDRDKPVSYSNASQPFQYAHPASEHPELVIVAFCGGSSRTIRENIEYAVYQQLMTPNGQKAEDPTDPNHKQFENPRQGGPIFMTKPLNEADY